MKLETLGKIQIGIAIGIFAILFALNIAVFYLGIDSFENEIRILRSIQIQDDKQMNTHITIYAAELRHAYFTFAEILIVADIILLLLITMMILDGAIILTKN